MAKGRSYGKLCGVMQARDKSGKPFKPVRRTGMTVIETSLMTRFGALTLRLNAEGYFELVAQSREGAHVIVEEGNLHAILDRAGLLPSGDLEALFTEEELEKS